MLGVGLKRKEAQQLSADWRGDQMAVRTRGGDKASSGRLQVGRTGSGCSRKSKKAPKGSLEGLWGEMGKHLGGVKAGPRVGSRRLLGEEERRQTP